MVTATTIFDDAVWARAVRRCVGADVCKPSGTLPIFSRHAGRDHRAQVVGALFFFPAEAQSRISVMVKVARRTPMLKRFM